MLSFCKKNEDFFSHLVKNSTFIVWKLIKEFKNKTTL